MGCTTSSSAKESSEQKKPNGDGPSTSRSKKDRKSNRNNSVYSNYAEPPSSQRGEDIKIESIDKVPSSTSLDRVNNIQDEIITPESINGDSAAERKQLSGETSGEINTAAAAGDAPLQRSNSKGSIVRNGVYYSESELAEENGVTWQPKYWTPDRIGKWVEDTEYPDGVKYSDIRRAILHSGSGNLKSSASSRKSHHSSSSIG